MGYGKFVPPQNFNKPIGFPTTSRKVKTHGGNSKGGADGKVKANHGAGVPSRISL